MISCPRKAHLDCSTKVSPSRLCELRHAICFFAFATTEPTAAPATDKTALACTWRNIQGTFWRRERKHVRRYWFIYAKSRKRYGGLNGPHIIMRRFDCDFTFLAHNETGLLIHPKCGKRCG